MWKDSNLTENSNNSQQDSKTTVPNKTSFHVRPDDKKAKFTTLKPIIIATFSAITIGVILGVLLLSMFTRLPNDNSNLHVTSPKNEKDNENSNTKKNEFNTYELPEINAHVLQVGLFSEKKNAEEWFAIYEKAHIPTFIWEKDNNFYLFAGALMTSDMAKQEALNIKEQGFDVFTKLWETEVQEVELTESEYTWVQAMIELWNKSLTTDSEQFLEVWGQLLADKPSEMPHISTLIEKITELHNNEMPEADKKKRQIILMEIWKHYEEL